MIFNFLGNLSVRTANIFVPIIIVLTVLLIIAISIMSIWKKKNRNKLSKLLTENNIKIKLNEYWIKSEKNNTILLSLDERKASILYCGNKSEKDNPKEYLTKKYSLPGYELLSMDNCQLLINNYNWNIFISRIKIGDGISNELVGYLNISNNAIKLFMQIYMKDGETLDKIKNEYSVIFDIIET
jgi:hypothetical protein